MNIRKAIKCKSHVSYRFASQRRLGLKRLARTFNILSVGEVSVVESESGAFATAYTASTLTAMLTDNVKANIGGSARQAGKTSLAALSIKVLSSYIPDQIKYLERFLGVGWSSNESCKYRFIVTYKTDSVNQHEVHKSVLGYAPKFVCSV
jgi:hypothetical protein